MSMAVGIIIGGAFTSIVNSLVNDVISPLLCFYQAATQPSALGSVDPT